MGNGIEKDRSTTKQVHETSGSNHEKASDQIWYNRAKISEQGSTVLEQCSVPCVWANSSTLVL